MGRIETGWIGLCPDCFTEVAVTVSYDHSDMLCTVQCPFCKQDFTLLRLEEIG